MKKKYSTLLNFALAACVATTVAGCSSDSSYSGTGGNTNQTNPTISIGGTVVDTNGNPLNGVTVSCQGEATTTAYGQWKLDKLQVVNVAGIDDETSQSYNYVSCVVVAPEGYLGATVRVSPEAQMDGMSSPDERSDAPYQITWIEGLYAEAGTAWLPKLASSVSGRLESCETGAGMVGSVLSLDLLAIDNNSFATQAPDQSSGSCPVGCETTYSTMGYQGTAGADGYFTIDNVPDDSILSLYVEGFARLRYKGDSSGSDKDGISTSGSELAFDKIKCSGSNAMTCIDIPDSSTKKYSFYVSTIYEGDAALGDICVETLKVGDTVDPCVMKTDGLVTQSQTPGRFLEDVDTVNDGIVVTFNEPMNPALVDINSVIKIKLSGDAYADVASVTMTSPTTMVVKTVTQISEDQHFTLWLEPTDFQDAWGNSLDGNCDYVGYDSETTRGTGSWDMVDLEYAMWNVPVLEVDEVTDGAQVCPGTGNAGLPELNSVYPNTFADNGDSFTHGLFENLNVTDEMTPYRLQAMADVLGQSSEVAMIDNGTARLTYTPPDAGVVSMDGCDIYSSGSPAVPNSGIFICDSAYIGDVKYIVTSDDYDTPVHISDPITLVDCVAPTTVLQYAYNTCGHIGYNLTFFDGNDTSVHPQDDTEGYDLDYAGHVCSTQDIDDLAPFGDGGENSAQGVEGALGNPTLNITCRLLKDPNNLPDSDISNTGFPTFDIPRDHRGIDFYELYDGDNGLENTTGWEYNADDRLYDATEFAAWGAFPDTIGVAFSEDIVAVDGTTPSLSDSDGDASTSISSWVAVNDVAVQDDNVAIDNNPTGNYPSLTGPATADLAMLTFTDIIALANDYHGELLDFDGTVVDSNGVPADNADLTINDLMAPFVSRAYWDGDVVIEFNEDIAVAFDSTCAVTIGGNSLSLDVVDAIVDGNTLTWTAVALDRIDVFDMGDWMEPIYNDVAPSADQLLAHGTLNTDCVTDTRGNSWNDWQYGTENGFFDPIGNQQCRTPEFLAVDVLGPFTDTKTAPAFVCDGNNDVVMSTSTSHPIDYTATFGCDVEALNSAEMIACMAAQIEFLDDSSGNGPNPVNGTNPDGMTLIDVVINPERTSAVFTLDNSSGLDFWNADNIIFYGPTGVGNGVYVSIYEITPNQLPIFSLVCDGGGP